MEHTPTETPEDILGRPPAYIEARALSDGFLPEFRIGDNIKGNHLTGDGIIDAIVLFRTNVGFIWGYRLARGIDYHPGDFFEKIAMPT